MITKRKIEIPIYRYPVKIIVTDNSEEINDICDVRDAKGLVLEAADRSTIIILDTDPKIIVHECEHLKNCIWRYIGQTVDISNDEVDAYLIEYLYEQVMKVVNRHNSKKLLSK